MCGGRDEVRQEFSENLEVIISVDDLDTLIHTVICRGQAAISCFIFSILLITILSQIISHAKSPPSSEPPKEDAESHFKVTNI